MYDNNSREVIIYNDFDVVDDRLHYTIGLNIIRAKKLILNRKLTRGVYVTVNIADITYSAKTILNDDSPIFDKYFIFDLNLKREHFIRSKAIFKVKQTHLFKSHLIGYGCFDICKIWSQSGRRSLKSQDVILSNYENRNICSGYLEIDICLLDGHDYSENELPIEDYVSNNFTLKIWPQLITFVFSVHKYTNLSIVSNPNSKTDDFKFKMNYFIRITIGSSIKSTRLSITKDNYKIWNEYVIFSNVPIEEYVVIELCKPGIFSKAIAFAELYIDCSLVHENNEDSKYLFGPNYINFNKRSALNLKKHSSVFKYAGSLLLSLRAYRDSINVSDLINETNCDPINESVEKMSLFYAALEISTINNLNGEDNNDIVLSIGGLYDFYGGVDFVRDVRESKCHKIDFDQMDQRCQIYMINALEKILSDADSNTMWIDEFIRANEQDEYKRRINDLIDALEIGVENFVEKYLRVDDFAVNELYRMRHIVDKMKYFCDNLRRHMSENASYHIKQFIAYIRKLLISFDCRWPYIIIWMLKDDRPIAYCKIRPNHIFYSSDDDESGVHCGSVQTVFMKPVFCSSHYFHNTTGCFCIVAKIDLFMWLGLASQSNVVFRTVFNRYKMNRRLDNELHLTCSTTQVVRCEIHVLKANFSHCRYEFGSMNAYVKAYFSTHRLESMVIKDNFYPIWNETLTFESIMQWTTSEQLNNRWPIILIEVLHKSGKYKNEIIGRIGVIPMIYNGEIKPLLPKWFNLYKGIKHQGKIYLAIQLTQINSHQKGKTNPNFECKHVPSYLLPTMDHYKIDVMFWGIRNIRKPLRKKIKIIISVDNLTIESDVLHIIKNHVNFNVGQISSQLYAPADITHFPIINFKLCANNSHDKLDNYGHYDIDSIANHFISWTVLDERDFILNSIIHYDEGSSHLNSPTTMKSNPSTIMDIIHILQNKSSVSDEIKLMDDESNRDSDEEISHEGSDGDWWLKYYAAIETLESNLTTDEKASAIQIYDCELENLAEFNAFEDWCDAFKLRRSATNYVCDVKCGIKIYKWPVKCEVTAVTNDGIRLNDGFFSRFPSNKPLKFTVRVYIVRCFNLKSKDLTNSCDPYVRLTIGSVDINDHKNYQKKTSNPIFGRSFEMEGIFPEDSVLKVSIWDHDIGSRDDLIGSTNIDLENRFFSKYRAFCGLSAIYRRDGVDSWRDVMKPSEILLELCSKYNISRPEFHYGQWVIFNEAKYCEPRIGIGEEIVENICLSILHQWDSMPLFGHKLVPEHVETRSLYHKKYLSVNQGKIQLWVDIFPGGKHNLKPMIDIFPKLPEDKELRIIIWSTEDVILDEYDIFTGTRVSDIYVKGTPSRILCSALAAALSSRRQHHQDDNVFRKRFKIIDFPEYAKMNVVDLPFNFLLLYTTIRGYLVDIPNLDGWLAEKASMQKTDIHYRSITGEGLFNWRMIFPFKYLRAENKIIIAQKKHFLAEASDEKYPPKIYLQLMDNDTLSRDDFLGSLTLDLSRCPRGSKTSSQCNEDVMKGSYNNIFEMDKCRGWWPFLAQNFEGINSVVGKIDMELQILSKEDAALNPVGKGRKPPEPLKKPDRPNSAFNWYLNPLKGLKYVLCHRGRKFLLILSIVAIFSIFIVTVLYSLPKYIVKKILQA